MKKCIYPDCGEKAEGPRWIPYLCRRHFIETLAIASKALGPSLCILCASKDNVTQLHLIATRDNHSSIDGEGDFWVCAKCHAGMRAAPGYLEQKGKA